MRQKQGIRLSLTVAVTAALMLIGAVSAQASVISIGSVLPEGFAPKKFERVQTLFNTALPEPGANLSSPVNGAIIRWRVQGAKGGLSTCGYSTPTVKAHMKPLARVKA